MTTITTLIMQDAMKTIPPEVHDPMIWPVQYMGDNNDWSPAVFMLAQSGSQWFIWEYYPNCWHINTDVPNKESGIMWIKGWMQDYAPEFVDLYFPMNTVQ